VRSVVLLSGGIDSTTCLALAVRESTADETIAVSYAYGQKHGAELDHAALVTAFYGVGHRILEIPRLFPASTSTLIQGGADNPSVAYEELDEGVSPAYVPFRNGVFLSMATAVALEVDADFVYFGAHAEDAQRWAYPDCTPEFIGSIASAMFVGSYMKVRLISPLQWCNKADVIRMGMQLGAPYHLTMSCYNGLEPACGLCPTCQSRRRAFEVNGVVDPIPYALVPA
jgi:7-cyano-7-deazaguanine synthase